MNLPGMEWLSEPQTWISLITLTLLEIVLGIDNIIFISILSGKLPKEKQAKARTTGLMLALITRVLLLCSLAWLAGLTRPLFSLPPLFGGDEPHHVSGRDLILLLGGLFLLGKSTREIHEKIEGEEHDATPGVGPSFASIIVQILILDLVFSLDSVITAVGMVKSLPIMISAVVIALIFMLFFSGFISRFIQEHPTLKMLALSFLMMIGLLLVAEGFHKEIPKPYVYFSMAFAVGVEFLNITVRRKAAKRRHVKVLPG